MAVEGTKHDQRYTITPHECMAIQILKADGWSPERIAMSFELTQPQMYTHVEGDCDHRYGEVFGP